MAYVDIAQKVADFRRDGFVKLPGLLAAEELAALQEDTARLITAGATGRENDSDYFIDPGENGETVFHRIQNVMDKSSVHPNPLLAAMVHPQILALVEALLGADFICDGEALVFKLPGNGRAVAVHADNDPAHPGWSRGHLAFNVDLYLDTSTLENGCLLVAPGSHEPPKSIAEIHRLGFDYPGLQPVPMDPGDVLFHNINVVHGSHTSRSQMLRRTLYYEYQSLQWILRDGLRPGVPVTEQWVHDRTQLMVHAIEVRQSCPYAVGERPFDYKLPGQRGIDVPVGKPARLKTPLGINRYF